MTCCLCSSEGHSSADCPMRGGLVNNDIKTSASISPYKAGEHYRQLVKSEGSPLLAFSTKVLRNQYHKLQSALPSAQLFYAVKSLSEGSVLDELAMLGSSFDLSSLGEISRIRQITSSPDRSIYTNPIKTDADIQEAIRYGCKTFVVDNVEEIKKLAPYRHQLNCLLRIGFSNADARIDLSTKFGCDPHGVLALIWEAQKEHVNIKGLSFHIGSQCSNSDSYVKAIKFCSLLMSKDWNGQGVDMSVMSVLDIGGGFPVSRSEYFDIDQYCQPIRRALDDLPKHIKVWAEPGRFISAPSVTSVSTIIGKAVRNGRIWYYLDDGLYGSYSGKLYDKADYPLEVFSDDSQRLCSVLAGPTCDSIDIIAEDVLLPDLNIGDIVAGHQMGAYSSASTTDFNSIKRAKFVQVGD